MSMPKAMLLRLIQHEGILIGIYRGIIRMHRNSFALSGNAWRISLPDVPCIFNIS
jgi:hypothetical protein